MLNKQEAEKMKEELYIHKYKPENHVVHISISKLAEIIDQFTETEPDEPFEIPVMQVWNDNIFHCPEYTMLSGALENWMLAIYANATSDRRIKWATVENLRVEARFWADDQFPKFGQDYSWVSENGCLERQFVHPSLIPTDCSRAIVRIEHA